MAKFNKREIEKKLRDPNLSEEEKNVLRLFYLSESGSGGSILAKLTLKNKKAKAIELFGEDGLYFEDLSIYYAVSNFAVLGTPLSDFSLRFRERELRRLVKNGIIKSYNVTDKGLELVKADGSEFKMTLLSSTLLEGKDDVVCTIQRMGMCHWASVDLCYKLPFPTKIVSGYIADGHRQDQFLHTWLEFENAGIEYVLDYTMNAYMRKDMYYNLRHVEQVVCEIKGEEFKNTLTQKQFEQISEVMDLKVLLTGWHNIKNDLIKNKVLFEDIEIKR